MRVFPLSLHIGIFSLICHSACCDLNEIWASSMEGFGKFLHLCQGSVSLGFGSQVDALRGCLEQRLGRAKGIKLGFIKPFTGFTLGSAGRLQPSWAQSQEFHTLISSVPFPPWGSLSNPSSRLCSPTLPDSLLHSLVALFGAGAAACPWFWDWKRIGLCA